MKILNLLAAGQTGGIEVLCQNIVLKSKEDNRACFLFSEGEIYDNLKKNNAKIFSTSYLNKNILRIVKTLEEYCKKEEIDIIIIHHGGMVCNIIYLLLMRKLKNIKFVRYLHGFFDKYSFGNNGNFIKRILVRKIMKRALRKSDLIIYISEAVKRSFENVFKIKDINNKVIYNGIPDEFFVKEPLNKKENEKIQMAYVGRLAKLKGVDVLIDAMKILCENDKELKLSIVGNGEEEENLKKQVEELKISDNIEFLGRKKDVLPILDSSDIFIYPSICDEGFGISVIEAMSRGCIPITFEKGGLPEIITNRKNGILVKEVNSKELAKWIQYVISLDDNEKEKIRQEAIKRANDFNLENTIKEIERELKTLKAE